MCLTLFDPQTKFILCCFDEIETWKKPEENRPIAAQRFFFALWNLFRIDGISLKCISLFWFLFCKCSIFLEQLSTASGDGHLKGAMV